MVLNKSGESSNHQPPPTTKLGLAKSKQLANRLTTQSLKRDVAVANTNKKYNEKG